jgi:hypothetical protein
MSSDYFAPLHDVGVVNISTETGWGSFALGRFITGRIVTGRFEPWDFM